MDAGILTVTIRTVHRVAKYVHDAYLDYFIGKSLLVTQNIFEQVTNLTPNQAAAQAIQLFSQEARLCDGTQPSKVARTTLEPGPASLAKSLPVKSVNPTCSEEGITSNSSTNSVSLIDDSIVISLDMDICKATNESDSIPQVLTHNNAQSSSNDQFTNNNEARIERISIEKATLSLPVSRTRIDSSDNLCCCSELNHNRVTTFPSNSMISDEENFQNILDRYKIYIPSYGSEPIRKRNDKHSNVKKTSRKYKIKKGYQRKRNVSCKRGHSVRNCSHLVTKLLVLNLYLRYLEKERYTSGRTKID